MTRSQKHVAEAYSPLYFLASLGAGGLTVTFFMYLMFWVPHAGRTVPIFEDLMAVFANGPILLQAAVVVAMAGIAIFAFLNVKSLIWNLSSLSRFRKTKSYEALRSSNGETTLLAGPLAAAMTVNAMFILGLVFVPGLWRVVEYLFPLALIAFLAIGVWAFLLIGDFLGRVLTKGGVFDVTAHNSFAQLMPAFALAMVSVGLAAPSAMSGNALVVGASLVLSTFFGTAAILYTVVVGVTAFSSMLHYGTAREAGPTLMVIVPIMTVLGIMSLRQSHGLHVGFELHQTAGETMIFLARLLTVQVLFLMLGLLVLRRQDYFADFVFGHKKSPGSYALVCPGVALSVMLHFFINKGLEAAGLIGKFGIAYWSLTAIALLAQIMMIALVFRLNRQHFSAKGTPDNMVPAE
ncbi:hypothetical protein EDD52_11951 [Primorskyibacter sedentarius]|uniref:Voltage-gated anion channel n=1 Tax=Primorskyibacter sedentarius TaxID=745311 RepID=A0A4R3J1U3_9RHOB|nr:hypothetical protein [Primorskyibacter sedentarius]TCS59748.1 hypothetical protein EDD52_11951 [Primorskyibacter sedentarius]